MNELAAYADLKICVAVSGGKDSVALLHYLSRNAREYGITVTALNCDHKIRGLSSARDSAFVKDLCAQYEIPLISFIREGDAPKTENEARQWRLDCYAAAAAQGPLWAGADAVATAHHLNDNAETVLFNLARGTALSGMEGITDSVQTSSDGKTVRIIHPIISWTRAQIDEYISVNQIPYVEDETNFTDRYTRNKIRLNVLPELERAVPGAAKAIYRFSRLAADDEEYFDGVIAKRKLIKITRHGCELARCEEKVIFKRAAVKALVTLNLKDYTSEQVRRLYELQFAEKGKRFEFLGYTAYKEDGRLVLCEEGRADTDKDTVSFFEHLNAESAFFGDAFILIACDEEAEGKLPAYAAAAESDGRIPAKFKILKFDRNAVSDTAVIRFMKEGDKITKFGGGTKNLGDFFTDRKIPLRLRRRIPLIADGGEVLAAGGVEISDKIKITPKTEDILYLICADYGAQTEE